MANIELVIKIDEHDIKQIDKIRFLIGGKEDRNLQINIINAIKNGIPIPKGHGDLIDRKELKKDVYTTTEWNGDIHRIIYEASIDDAKPIIEEDAYKENEE